MFWQNLKRLWRHPRFRRILGVRIFTQAADGTLQVGMASYVLLSPEQQPDAWSIAMVLAITLLPFCLLGPFVSLVLDRWSRQRILVGTDGLRCLIALMLGVLVWNGARDKASHIALLILLLVAMSMNRFLLTALTAGLEHTIDKREYLTASSIMPIIGPLGLMLGAVIATAVRLIAGRHMPVHHADTIIFVISATLFAFSVGLGMRFDRWELGPTRIDRSERASDVLRSALELSLIHI